MRTVLMDLPCSIKGFLTVIEDEEIIVLNSRLSWEANRETYQHELEHIEHGDLFAMCNVDLLEYFRHEKEVTA